MNLVDARHMRNKLNNNRRFDADADSDGGTSSSPSFKTSHRKANCREWRINYETTGNSNFTLFKMQFRFDSEEGAKEKKSRSFRAETEFVGFKISFNRIALILIITARCKIFTTRKIQNFN